MQRRLGDGFYCVSLRMFTQVPLWIREKVSPFSSYEEAEKYLRVSIADEGERFDVQSYGVGIVEVRSTRAIAVHRYEMVAGGCDFVRYEVDCSVAGVISPCSVSYSIPEGLLVAAQREVSSRHYLSRGVAPEGLCLTETFSFTINDGIGQDSVRGEMTLQFSYVDMVYSCISSSYSPLNQIPVRVIVSVNRFDVVGLIKIEWAHQIFSSAVEQLLSILKMSVPGEVAFTVDAPMLPSEIASDLGYALSREITYPDGG